MAFSFLRRSGRASGDTKSSWGGFFRKSRAKTTNNKSNKSTKNKADVYRTSNLKRNFPKKVADMYTAAKRGEIQRLRLLEAAKTNPQLLHKANEALRNMTRAYELHRLGEKQLDQVYKSSAKKLKAANVPYGPVVMKGNRVKYHKNVKPELLQMVQRFRERNQHLPTQTNWTNLSDPYLVGPVTGLRHLIKRARAGESLNASNVAMLHQAAEKARNRAKRHFQLMDWERQLLNLFA